MYIKPLNGILKSVQKRYPGKLLYFPAKISIETGNICNLRCPLCPTNDEAEKQVPKGFMSFENFKIIFDKIRPFVKTLDLFNWGEPFLNKDIGKMVKYVKEQKPSVRIFIDSNLNAISDDNADLIVRYGLDVLKVSCDGATQRVYEQYRRGGKIEDVLANLRKILKKKKELGGDKPRIIWKYLVFSHNEGEVAAARALADEMGIGFEASGMRINCGKEIFEKVDDSVKRDSEWIPASDEYNNYKDLTAGKKACEKPWRTLTIDWNGNVAPCGAIYDCGKYGFGNLLKDSFGKVWNGEKFVKARKIIAGKCGDDPGVICSICKANGYQFF